MSARTALAAGAFALAAGLAACAGGLGTARTAAAPAPSPTQRPVENGDFRADRRLARDRDLHVLGRMADKRTGKTCTVYEMNDRWGAPHIALICDRGSADGATRSSAHGISHRSTDTAVE